MRTKYNLSNSINFNNYNVIVDKAADEVKLNTQTIKSEDIGAVIEMLRAAKKSFPKK